MSPRVLFPINSAPGGGTTTVNTVLTPWGPNRKATSVEARAQYKIVGQRNIMVGDVSSGLGEATRFTAGHREYTGSLNWKMMRKIEFQEGTATLISGKNIPFVFAYADIGADNTYTAMNYGAVLKGEYRFYWKNLN